MVMDKNVEAAMIKTCLLFDNKSQQKREFLFQKKLLADLFCKKYNSVDSAMIYLAKEMPSYAFDRLQVKNALEKLQSSGFIEFSKDSYVTLSNDVLNRGNKSAEAQQKNFEQIVSEILQDIENNTSNIGNRQQLRQNIKNCLEYYIQISCYNFLALDDKIPIIENKALAQKASSNLLQDDRFISQILLSIGSVLAKPSETQRKTLEIMAQAQITIRLMGVDPMLQNFKRSLIASKVFVLDTDVVLYLITDNGERSRQYKSLLQQLLDCGCNIYIPDELFDEVYDHAEAAKKMYHFVSPVLNSDAGKWVEFGIKNVFLESYYRMKAENKLNISWDRYIDNYIQPKEGIVYTKDVVKEEIGQNRNIHYGEFPYGYNIYDSKSPADINLCKVLYEKTLAATLQTEKAGTREDEKNERIAKTDAKLFLNIKKLNELEIERNGKHVARNDYLCHKYYVITNTFRIYSCTKELGISDRLFCSPSTLMAFMIEAGIIDREKISMLSLFENPFLTYIAEQSWDDVKQMAQAGIDFKGKNIIRLRYDLQNHLNTLLTAKPGTEIYTEVIDEIKQKGYNFEPQIEHARDLEKQNAEKDKQIEELKSQIEKLKAEKKIDIYKVRIAGKGKNKRSRK